MSKTNSIVPTGGEEARSSDHEAVATQGLHHRGQHAGNGESSKSTAADASCSFDVETPPQANAKDANAAAEAANGTGTAAADTADGNGTALIEHVGYRDIAKQFSLLGWTAFGGPAAHIGIMQKVRRAAGIFQLVRTICTAQASYCDSTSACGFCLLACAKHRALCSTAYNRTRQLCIFCSWCAA